MRISRPWSLTRLWIPRLMRKSLGKSYSRCPPEFENDALLLPCTVDGSNYAADFTCDQHVAPCKRHGAHHGDQRPRCSTVIHPCRWAILSFYAQLGFLGGATVVVCQHPGCMYLVRNADEFRRALCMYVGLFVCMLVCMYFVCLYVCV